MEFLPWKDIENKYRDTWVAITEWEEDECGDVVSGHVAYHNPNRKQFYAYLKEHFPQRHLAVRFTGNVRGPFFLGI
jgi:hypothetical protein